MRRRAGYGRAARTLAPVIGVAVLACGVTCSTVAAAEPAPAKPAVAEVQKPPAPATPPHADATPAAAPAAAVQPGPAKPAPDKPAPAASVTASVFGQTAWQPPPPPAAATPASLAGGVPVTAPSSAAEASLRVSNVHLLGLIDHSVEGAVKGSDHVEVGHVVDVLVDDKGDATAVVIEIAGFMGVGNRHIALASDLLTIPADLKAPLRTELTPAQLRSAPTYDARPGEVTVVSGAESTDHTAGEAKAAPDQDQAPGPSAAPPAPVPSEPARAGTQQGSPAVPVKTPAGPGPVSPRPQADGKGDAD